MGMLPKKRGWKTYGTLYVVQIKCSFVRGNNDKARRVTADRARKFLIDETSHDDWYEQALVTETRIKAFFGATIATQHKLINSALIAENGDSVTSGDTTVPLATDAVVDGFEASVNIAVSDEIIVLEQEMLAEIDNFELLTSDNNSDSVQKDNSEKDTYDAGNI